MVKSNEQRKLTKNVIESIGGVTVNEKNVAKHFIGGSNGSICHVVDGDTFYFQSESGKKIHCRLLYVDAPEQAQPHSELSTNYLKSLIKEPAYLITSATDRYNRSLVLLSVNCVCINDYLVENGLCWAYWRCALPHEYLTWQKEAQEKKLGIWQFTGNIDPYLFRHPKH